MKTSLLSLAAAAGSAAAGTVRYAGINIAGLDFGTNTDGWCNPTNAVDPGDTGISQMQHFVADDGLNVFRLPVSWQFLLNNKLGGPLDPTNFAIYHRLVQGCLLSGAEICVLDLHNFMRWNGAIIGHDGGPTHAQFASLWSQLAAHYVDQPKVAFGIMNEPHDVDIASWAAAAQAAVTAIRRAGCTAHTILLPGIDWSHATTFLSRGSAAALSDITNPDGTTHGLVFDLHAYLDGDGSGRSTSCSTDNADAFSQLGDWLRTKQRQAMLTETGGGANDASCLDKLCRQLDVLNRYSDVYLGWVGWAAGMFDSYYPLTETPVRRGNSWADQRLVTQCIVGKFRNNKRSTAALPWKA